jgi:hypothetical protein
MQLWSLPRAEIAVMFPNMPVGVNAPPAAPHAGNMPSDDNGSDGEVVDDMQRRRSFSTLVRFIRCVNIWERRGK